MQTKEVIDYFGGRAKVAAALEISPAAISQWGVCPPELRQYQLQALSDGALKVGCTPATAEHFRKTAA